MVLVLLTTWKMVLMYSLFSARRRHKLAALIYFHA